LADARDATDAAAVAVSPDDGAGRPDDGASRLADFTVTTRTLAVAALAVPIGAMGAVVALALLKTIGLITNVLWFGRIGSDLVAPADADAGALTIVWPVVGGAVIGLMARYGSEGIRGHGIPEAMENILVRGSRVQPRLAFLKPISSAISIGTGGPFGAEGPIILTGGAVGSLAAQFLRLTSAERKTLLVAGAAAGMTGVFGTPMAAALLAVELLLFEWKPRSLIPVGVATTVAMAVRIRFSDAGLLDPAPLFEVPDHPVLTETELAGALAVGVACGLLAWVLTGAVYGAEDAFKRLPIHWAWWPAIGGVIVGVGGLIEPRALGVGYDVLAGELAGTIAVSGLITLLVVKLIIWSIALGSGTSGGILAPLLIMGAAVGGVLGPVLPGGSPAVWGLIGMASAMAGVMRSPFTSILFAFELTHDRNALLPLLIGALGAYAMSVLVLKRSILTEKVARKGVHVTREYSVDPLDALFVVDVMTTDVTTLAPERPVAEVMRALRSGRDSSRQRLFPVLDEDGSMLGVLTRGDLVGADPESRLLVADLMRREPVLALPGETLRTVADRMVEHGVGALPVVRLGSPRRVVGLITQSNLFRARVRLLDEERTRQRVLRIRPLIGRRPRGGDEPPADGGAAGDGAGLVRPGGG
jgi:H+/Cl- antiporter ClcA/predicted transcriptional regulator